MGMVRCDFFYFLDVRCFYYFSVRILTCCFHLSDSVVVDFIAFQFWLCYFLKHCEQFVFLLRFMSSFFIIAYVAYAIGLCNFSTAFALALATKRCGGTQEWRAPFADRFNIALLLSSLYYLIYLSSELYTNTGLLVSILVAEMCVYCRMFEVYNVLSLSIQFFLRLMGFLFPYLNFANNKHGKLHGSS